MKKFCLQPSCWLTITKKRAVLDHEIDKTLAEIQKILGIKINIENHED